jgi:hypothetical protein
MSIVSGVPRAAQLQTNPTQVTWGSNSAGFNGYVWLGLELPNGYSQPTLVNSYVTQQLGRYIKVPIVNGSIDQTTGVPWNSDIDPPGTAYVAYYCDNNNTIIAPATSTASAFTINSGMYTLTVPALPSPSYSGVSLPVPQVSSQP